MRCLTLAEALKENGVNSIFITRMHDGNLNNLIIKKGFLVKELSKRIGTEIGELSINGDDYENWLSVSEQQDAEETIDTIIDKQSDWGNFATS